MPGSRVCSITTSLPGYWRARMALISSGSEVDAALIGGTTWRATSEDKLEGLRGRVAGSLVSQALGNNRVNNINQEYKVRFISGSLQLLKWFGNFSGKGLEEL